MSTIWDADGCAGGDPLLCWSCVFAGHTGKGTSAMVAVWYDGCARTRLDVFVQALARETTCGMTTFERGAVYGEDTNDISLIVLPGGRGNVSEVTV